MRLSLILGLCIVLCGAMLAQAGLMPITNVTGTGVLPTSFSYSRGDTTMYFTGSSATSLQELDIYITGALPSGKELQLFEGTIAADGTGYIAGTRNSGQYGAAMCTGFGWNTDNNDWESSITGAPQSYVNLAATNGATTFARTTLTTTNGGFSYGNSSTGYASYSSFFGGWLTKYNGSYSTAADQPGVPTIGTWMPDAKLSNVETTDPVLTGIGYDTTLLAQLWVKPGTNVTFTGNPAWGGWGYSGSLNLAGSFDTATPEPSTIVLAASGLIGLLCYAWRKRR